MPKVLIDEWCKDENLLLLEGWCRDGFTLQDMALRIGVDIGTLCRWKNIRPEIAEAMKAGKEIVDYKVENALLKSALGYKTKETTVRVLMRGGTVIEKEKITTKKEQAPNVHAIQCWLYNRRPDKWKNMNSRANIMDDLEEDSNIQITVTRAKQSELENNEDEEWTTEVNDSVNIRKATEEEKKQNRKNKQKQLKESKDGQKTKVETEPEDDLDYWPEDWEDDNDE